MVQAKRQQRDLGDLTESVVHLPNKQIYRQIPNHTLTMHHDTQISIINVLKNSDRDDIDARHVHLETVGHQIGRLTDDEMVEQIESVSLQ